MDGPGVECVRAGWHAPNASPSGDRALSGNREACHAYTKGHWLDYDPVALAVLVIGIGVIELLAWGI
jgi:uncharacterized protein YbdZ (MbtH family)